MSAYFATTDRIASLGSLDFDTASAVAVFQPGKPANVKRIIGVVTEQSAGTSVVTVAVRNVDDSSSTTIGTFNLPAGLTVNSVFQINIAGVNTAVLTSDGNGVSQPATVTTGRVNGRLSNQPGEIEVNPGQELSITSDGAGTAGIANMYVEYQEEGNNPLRFNPTDITFTFA